MSSTDLEDATELLRRFIDKKLSSIECDELHLELVFHGGSRFRTQCPWRIFRGDSLLFGHGDIDGSVASDVLERLVGLTVISTSISGRGDTDLCFENDYLVQVILDAVQYEVWDAHLDEGWVIFSGGCLTVFPPAPVTPSKSRTN